MKSWKRAFNFLGPRKNSLPSIPSSSSSAAPEPSSSSSAAPEPPSSSSSAAPEPSSSSSAAPEPSSSSSAAPEPSSSSAAPEPSSSSAAPEPSSSSSAPLPSHNRHWKYDVFLSFRGEDTRLNFVDHLYAALDQKGIVTFKDDKRLERGTSISSELLKAIEESKIALVILSPNYANSSWCLEELSKIVQCKQEMGQVVLPVFYQVPPSVIRKTKGKFLQAFTEHEEVYWDNRDKVNKWKAALAEVASIAGWDVSNAHETKIIKQIVKCILNRSLHTSLNVDKGFVGMDSRVDDLLCNYIKPFDNGVRIIGICGMGGIGKTTLARAVYDKIIEASYLREGVQSKGKYNCQDFDHCCFLSNVREMSDKDGLVSLQGKLLTAILKEKTGYIEDEYAGAALIERRLRNLRVLVVIDDVDKTKQLQRLAGNRDWFGPGSRIIITSGNRHLLTTHGVDGIYEATGLNYDEALQLLSLKAFKKCPPPDEYLKLCNEVIAYARGLPLAIEVIGPFLCGRSTKEWQNAIDRLKDKLERSIMDVLRISFDGLEETEKEIFLHIACFYKGKDRDRVTEILAYCQLYPEIGLSVLSDKSLVTISDNVLWMHDLLQELGWELVRQQSPLDPGKRSRLWFDKDIHYVLKKNKGTEMVQGIVLDSPEPKLDYLDYRTTTAFSNLSQLRLLQIHQDMYRGSDLVYSLKKSLVPQALTNLSDSLRLIEWRGYPLRSLPEHFQPDELIELSLCESYIVQLWNGIKYFPKLKFIKLCYCQYIVMTPDFTGVQNLESLDLEGCKNLVGVHQTLGVLKNLVFLSLKDCKSLKSLPGKIEMESLETFILSGCSNVKQIPEFFGDMKCLSELCLDETSIERLPVSIERLSGLTSLNLSNCKNLVCLPSNINSLKSLTNLNVSGCLNLGESWGMMEFLSFVQNNPWKYFADPWKYAKVTISYERRMMQRVRGSLNKFLPSGMMQRVNTERTSFWLPLSGLRNLTDLNLRNCNLGEGAFGNDIGCLLPSLVALNLSGNNFVRLPSIIRSFEKLENINLENCKRLTELSGLPLNRRLDVRADGCSSLEALFDASIFSRLEESYFSFINCFKLSDNRNDNINVAFEIINCFKLSDNRNDNINVAFEMLKMFLHQGISNTRETFQIVIPGSEISAWFIHQSVGGSLFLPPSDWNSRKFAGYALCVVFKLQEHHLVDELSKYQFKTFNATHYLVCRLKLNGRELQVSGRQPAFRFSEEFCQVDSDHLWLFYVSSDKYFGTEEHNSCSQIEFAFGAKGPGLMVKKFGVRIIYEQDVQAEGFTGSP